MTEPITVNRSLIVPNTGDLVAAWGTSALNPNFQMIDTMFGGVTTISLSVATTITLSVPPSTGVWPGGNPAQSVNSLIRFTGAQTGLANILFTLPGFYIIDNRCTGTSAVRLNPVTGPGNYIGAPPGQKIHVFYDGTDLDYVDMPAPGSALDLHINTTTLPQWMTVCAVAPYLVKDGSVYTASIYPALAALLGSTFGGNGVTTFGVPDERARARIAVDTVQAASGATSARITFAIAGFTGSLLGASGGDQRMQTHTHGITDPGHSHTTNAAVSGLGNIQTQGGFQFTVGPGATINNATTNITINTSGTGSSQNIQPSIISFLPLIKT